MTNPRSSPQRRPARSAGVPGARAARPAVLRVLGQLRTPEWVVLGATIALSVWAWIAYVVAQPQDFAGFFLWLAIATVAGGTLQAIFVVFVRPSGTLRQRFAFGSYGGSFAGSWILVLAPPLVIGLLLLVITPPATSGAGFDPDMGIYQVIGMTVVLGLAFTAVGAGAVFVVIVVPVVMLIAAVLPAGRGETEQTRSAGLSRLHLVLGPLVMISAVGFALSITSVAATTGSTRFARMQDQFFAFITGNGNPVAIASAWFFIAAIVVLGIINNRAEARRRKKGER